MRVSVVGSGAGTEAALEVAEHVGSSIAERGHTVVCGGRGGVMEAACRGAANAGGTTIGILPGADMAEANPYVDIPILTGFGEGRNVLVAMNGEGMIAIDGRYGTLSEIAFALKFGRPVAGIDTHDVPDIESVSTPAEAIAYLESAVRPVE